MYSPKIRQNPNQSYHPDNFSNRIILQSYIWNFVQISSYIRSLKNDDPIIHKLVIFLEEQIHDTKNPGRYKLAELQRN